MDDLLINGKPLKTLKVVEFKEWLQKRGVKTGKKKKADLILRWANLYKYLIIL